MRVPKALSASKNNQSDIISEWPDDSSFRVDRWERDRDRDRVKQPTKSTEFEGSYNEKIPNRRPLPRSSRRRV